MQTLKQMGRNVEMPQWTQAYYEARELAMTRMQSEAERPAPSDAVRRLAVEVLSAAQQLGSATDIAVHSALYGLAAIV